MLTVLCHQSDSRAFKPLGADVHPRPCIKAGAAINHRNNTFSGTAIRQLKSTALQPVSRAP